MNARELFDSLNLLDEHERVEAKRASDVGKSLLETVCAFANEPGLGGGWLLLGAVRDEMALFPAYAVEGLAQPDQVAADLASQCRSSFNVPVRVEISTEELAGQAVIVAHVPEAPPHDKPVFFKSRGLPAGALRRVGGTDQHCTEDDLLLLYQGRDHESFDAAIVPETTLADIAPEALADYRQARAATNPDATELHWSDQELLQALGCIRQAPDRTGRPVPRDAPWHPTVAGLVLFGTPQALRRCMPMTRVDYIRVPGREWAPEPGRRFDSIELRDSLLRLIRRAQAAVLDDLPVAFSLPEGALQRQDTPALPLAVVREAIVNALMHRNYRSASPVQIIRYSNRVEVRNAGFSLKAREHLGEPGSLQRNPRIAAVLYDTRFAETKGSGIRVMRDAMRQAGLTPPLFESDRGQDLFVARYAFHHFLGPDDLAWLAGFKALQLSEDEAKALVFVKEFGAIDNAAYRDLAGVDALAASQALRRLREAGLLAQKGRGSATFYLPQPGVLPDAVVAVTGAPAPDSSGEIAAEADGLSSKLPGLSSKLGSLSSKVPGLSSMVAGLSSMAPGLSSKLQTLAKEAADGQQATAGPARNALLATVPGELAARIGALGLRSVPADVRAAVLALCALRPWGVEDLATVLRRNPEYVRQNHLRPLMREGLLVQTRPDEPQHPQQAYRTLAAPQPPAPADPTH